MKTNIRFRKIWMWFAGSSLTAFIIISILTHKDVFISVSCFMWLAVVIIDGLSANCLEREIDGLNKYIDYIEGSISEEPFLERKDNEDKVIKEA